MALTDKKVKAFKSEGRETVHADGRSLFLVVGQGGTKTWVVRYRDPDGKSKRRLLGNYPQLKVQEARDQASVLRIQLKNGLDFKPEGPKPTNLAVNQCIGLYLEEYRAKGFSRPEALTRRFDNDVVPAIGDKMILNVTDEDIQRVSYACRHPISFTM